MRFCVLDGGILFRSSNAITITVSGTGSSIHVEHSRRAFTLSVLLLARCGWPLATRRRGLTVTRSRFVPIAFRELFHSTTTKVPCVAWRGVAWPGERTSERERVNFVTRAIDEENLHPKDVLLSVPLVRNEGETSGRSVGFNGTDKPERFDCCYRRRPALVSPDDERPLCIFDERNFGSGSAAISALETNDGTEVRSIFERRSA